MEEDQEFKHAIKFLVACAIIVGLVAALSVIGSCCQSEAAIKAGMVQRSDDHGNIIWVKP